MNWHRIEGNCMELEGKVHEQWGKLTGEGLHVIAGRREAECPLQQRERAFDDAWPKLAEVTANCE